MKYKAIKITLAAIVSISAAYYTFFTLDREPMTQAQVLNMYQYQTPADIGFEIQRVSDRVYKFNYVSFDGSQVNGQISYPDTESDKYPVILGMHAMGRSFPRWWAESIKGRPTVTQVNKLTEFAHKKGYAVIAIDARYHGSRKDPNNSLSSIMMSLNYLGDKTVYQDMVHHSVLDYRVLLDWIGQQENLDSANIKATGYSMGGQMALLLASVDDRLSGVLSIVPPHIETDEIALVAPGNVVSLLNNKSVLLVTANSDEYSTPEQNDSLFNAIGSSNKDRIALEGGHILPAEYVNSVAHWF